VESVRLNLSAATIPCFRSRTKSSPVVLPAEETLDAKLAIRALIPSSNSQPSTQIQISPGVHLLSASSSNREANMACFVDDLA
jgi:hypothetical protein